MVIVRRVGLLAAGAAVLLATGCSGAPTTPPTAPSAAPTTAVASPSPEQAVACPDGRYRVTGLEGRGQAAAIGKGTGGDIAADFSGGDFLISSDGAEAVRLDLGPTEAEMRFDGTIKGTYEGDASDLRLTTTGADGEVRIKGFGVTRTRSAGELSDQLFGQSVTAQVACDDDAGTAVVTLPNAALTLTKQG